MRTFSQIPEPQRFAAILIMVILALCVVGDIAGHTRWGGFIITAGVLLVVLASWLWHFNNY